MAKQDKSRIRVGEVNNRKNEWLYDGTSPAIVNHYLVVVASRALFVTSCHCDYTRGENSNTALTESPNDRHGYQRMEQNHKLHKHTHNL